MTNYWLMGLHVTIFCCKSLEYCRTKDWRCSSERTIEATGQLGTQGASSHTRKQGFGSSMGIICGRCVDFHLIGTMMGFHAVKSRQNETFHCHNHMNIYHQDSLLLLNRKEGSKLSLQFCCWGAYYLAIEKRSFWVLCPCVSYPWQKVNRFTFLRTKTVPIFCAWMCLITHTTCTATNKILITSHYTSYMKNYPKYFFWSTASAATHR
jgi:hypothetical protein